jgi:hypothetical protein
MLVWRFEENNCIGQTDLCYRNGTTKFNCIEIFTESITKWHCLIDHAKFVFVNPSIDQFLEKEL